MLDTHLFETHLHLVIVVFPSRGTVSLLSWLFYVYDFLWICAIHLVVTADWSSKQQSVALSLDLTIHLTRFTEIADAKARGVLRFDMRRPCTGHLHEIAIRLHDQFWHRLSWFLYVQSHGSTLQEDFASPASGCSALQKATVLSLAAAEVDEAQETHRRPTCLGKQSHCLPRAPQWRI